MPAHDEIQARFLNVRSTDPESLAKAAAWVWYLHGNGSGRKGVYVYQTQKRERSESRFKSEATTKSLSRKPLRALFSEDVWDCESKLYDSFELLSFTNRLNPKLTEYPSMVTPVPHHRQSPPHLSFTDRLTSNFTESPTISATKLHHAVSAPRSSIVTFRNSADAPRELAIFPLGRGNRCAAERADKGVSEPRWSIGGFVRVLKKAATNTNPRKQMRARISLDQKLEIHHHQLLE